MKGYEITVEKIREKVSITTVPITTALTTTIQTTTTILSIPELNLIIDIPKTSINVGETFQGQYIVERKGNPYEIYIVTLCRREGYEKECVTRARGSLKNLI